MTDKQTRFIEAYKLLNDGTKAAISAGYSAKSAHIEANRLMKSAKVIHALDEWRKERQKDFKREDFIDLALNDYRSLEKTEANAPRFLQLAGQAAGHVGNSYDSRPNQTLNITMNTVELNALGASDKWTSLRALLEQA